MECREITETPVALEIMQTPGDQRLQQLFACIYSLFQASFLTWIQRKYSYSPCKEKLWEDAKDAFQNGMMTLFRKSQNKEFTITGSLKTTIYSFGLLQLMALFKKEKSAHGANDYLKSLEMFFEEDLIKVGKHELLNERERDLLEALTRLPKKHRDILIMKFFGKLKSKQIAEKLNVTPGNIDNESTKAYKELRKILQSKSSFQTQKE
ncbi:MAG TPA: sigma-70 family RNA polymerase sigma factor [Flavitalea sp.]|nr:sigma-70 family RNA polymerase sigma factor [Flavitalea sp.]